MIECDGKMQGYDLEYAWSMTKPADCRSITVASFNHLKWHPSGTNGHPEYSEYDR
jgi:hypothetical protein